MTLIMRKKRNDFDEIEILKERYEHRILQQELKVRSSFKELSDNLTGVTLFNQVRENLFTGQGFAFKLGFMAVTLLRKRLALRKKK
jgi:hypothetical protein